ncbi:multidrug effflux MFS transporter [Lipingzhangella sp. LS1_29]|uniref:Multidrug effflux MFS transporter n=1 Tax=Lipingzhangella rawalii TaxID=2055835 RepID=A0ABU2H1Y2_9ACTN|nr:multidrug effflux MFS transporter [Lipingzhangella rawalii]MDS1269296.1 multidrug effflux MFS transporter [Lipingzhangella rawalii]
MPSPSPAAASTPATSASSLGSDTPPSAAYPRRFVVLLVFVLGVLAATGPLATDLYLPAMPAIADDLATTEARVQLTLTAIMVGLAVGQLAIGPMSDAWGRRRPLLIGMSVFTVASLLCTVVPTVEAFVAVRFVQGVAGAAGAVISRAIVRDLFAGDEVTRILSRLILVMGIAPMVGPIIGGQLLLVGPWQLGFVLLAVVSTISVVLVYTLLPESLPASRRRPRTPGMLLRTFTGMLRTPAFILPTLILSLSFGMMFTYIASFSFVAQSQLGATAQQFSLVFAVNTVGLISGTQVNALLIGRVGIRRRLVCGLAAAVLLVSTQMLLAATGHTSLVGLTVLLFLLMLSVGFVLPNATSLAIASQEPSVAGTASALIGSMQFALGGSVSALAGLTSTGEATLTSMSAVMLGAGLGAGMLCLGLRRVTP